MKGGGKGSRGKVGSEHQGAGRSGKEAAAGRREGESIREEGSLFLLLGFSLLGGQTHREGYSMPAII